MYRDISSSFFHYFGLCDLRDADLIVLIFLEDVFSIFLSMQSVSRLLIVAE